MNENTYIDKIKSVVASRFQLNNLQIFTKHLQPRDQMEQALATLLGQSEILLTKIQGGSETHLFCFDCENKERTMGVFIITDQNKYAPDLKHYYVGIGLMFFKDIYDKGTVIAGIDESIIGFNRVELEQLPIMTVIQSLNFVLLHEFGHIRLPNTKEYADNVYKQAIEMMADEFAFRKSIQGIMSLQVPPRFIGLWLISYLLGVSIVLSNSRENGDLLFEERTHPRFSLRLFPAIYIMEEIFARETGVEIEDNQFVALVKDSYWQIVDSFFYSHEFYDGTTPQPFLFTDVKFTEERFDVDCYLESIDINNAATAIINSSNFIGKSELLQNTLHGIWEYAIVDKPTKEKVAKLRAEWGGIIEQKKLESELSKTLSKSRLSIEDQNIVLTVVQLSKMDFNKIINIVRNGASFDEINELPEFKAFMDVIRNDKH